MVASSPSSRPASAGSAGNHAGLPLFDLVFGTFDNPREFADEAVLGEGASARLLDLLRSRDVAMSVDAGRG